MGKFWGGVTLLLLLLALGLWMGKAMEERHQSLEAALTRAADMAVEGDVSGAMSLARESHTRWESRAHWVATVADHTPMEEIDSLFAQMEIYGRSGATAEFAACCSRVSQLVKAVGEAHGLSWWNLL